MAPHLGRMAYGYFEAFTEAGFTEAQAVYLTACQLHSSPGRTPGA